MVSDDSQQFVVDDSGTFWGLYGAAGVLLRCPGHAGEPLVLLQHRALYGHFGGTWGFPGGAKNSQEEPIDTALRELYEETGIFAEDIYIHNAIITFTSISGWKYTTVIAEALRILPLHTDSESIELRWVPESDVARYGLHPAVAQIWPQLTVEYSNGPLTQEYRLQQLENQYYWNGSTAKALTS